MQIPIMAGSVLPAAQRKPPLVLAKESTIKQAFVIGYGPHEAYGFHALEALQCMVERRKGGETGVYAVQAMQGKKIKEYHSEEEWPEKLLESAMKAIHGAPYLELQNLVETATFYQIYYRDGLRATIAMANDILEDFSFAAELDKKEQSTVATWFDIERKRPYSHFENLTRLIDQFIHTRKAPFPIERTLLTTGLIHGIMKSLNRNGELILTPELNIRYT